MSKEYSGGDLLPADELNEIVRSGGLYGASSGGTDAYAITVSPVPDNLTAGDVFRFKADVGNTGACTLNVNGLGAKAIKKNVSEDLDTGDILAGQYVTVEYDGTNFQMISPLGTSMFDYLQLYLFTLIASDNLRTSDDAQVTVDDATYTLQKEILLNETSGIIRVKFRMNGSVCEFSCRIYKNGVAVGTERTISTATSDDQTYSEDLDFVSGDLIQIYGKRVSGTITYLTNFRLYYDKIPNYIDNTVTL